MPESRHSPGIVALVPEPRRAELIRLSLIALTSLWLSHAYLAPRLIGTGDALWYHHLLSDAVIQFRAGVFPVFVGQSDYSFNGAVYPLRAAPYHQYFAGFLDFITFQTLGSFALQHLAIVLSFFGGAFVAYSVLVWIAPYRRWSAGALAILYVMCPGVAGLFYAQDLYMSGMTLPWVPLVFAALVKSFDDDGLFPLAVLAAGLAMLWWAHTPIALWATFIASFGQLVRIAAIRLDAKGAFSLGLAALVFCLLAAYPVISFFLLRSPGETIVPYIMNREELLKVISDSFPGSVMPIDLAAPNISFLQLGYGLWAALIVSIGAWLVRPRLYAVGVLLISALFLLGLVFPVPGTTRALWIHFPETLVGMTLYWPMQRFYILIAAAVVVCAQRLLREFSLEKKAIREVFLVGLVLALVWSTYEASKLVDKALIKTDVVEDSRIWDLPENVAVQRHTYGLFPRRPAYFTHGVVDPRMESHLLDAKSMEVVASDYDVAKDRTPQGEFQGTIDANPGILNLDPAFTLLPGEHYLLTFQFSHPDTTGVLQIRGERFYREYLLPVSGEAKSFGSGSENEKSIAVWTSGSVAESIHLRFIPTGEHETPDNYMPFAKYDLQKIDVNALPIHVTSLIPYVATVHSSQSALLETPRMFIPGYGATVNGAPVPVQKSQEGLVAFPVPEGTSQVELRYVGSTALHVAFWTSFTGWLVVVLLFVRWAVTRLRRRSLAAVGSG
jgi:hypothetical protein